MPSVAANLRARKNLMLTLLLDLDETLLSNNSNVFVQAYLNAWSDFISPSYDPQRLSKALLDGTKIMAVSPRPDCTLRELFNEIFYPTLGMTPEEFLPFENQFYSEIFPKLQPLTSRVPGAVEMVNTAFERGYQVAIATNPYFPRTAIEQRLAWAGLPVDQYPFAIVPGIETFHFAKPHPAFFAELLAYLGWPDHDIVMVGDDPEVDIRSADRFGLFTYQTVKPGASFPTDLQMRNGRGSINELTTWLEDLQQGPHESQSGAAFDPVATLQATPAVLRTISQNMTEAQWTHHPDPAEWCPAEIVCHLRDVDIEVNIPRIRKIIQEDNPFLPGMDTDRWNEERQYHYQDGLQALDSFTLARIRLLALLTETQSTHWQRTARHSIFGRTDINELVSFIAGHDRIHIQQLIKDVNYLPG
jgi:FMN phosphatase YigB (HAD superfamily)